MVASTVCLMSMISGTASTTRVARASAAGSVTTATVPATATPLSAALVRLVSTRARAAFAARASFSMMVTLLPATAKAWAMPAPMRPPP